jgi:hypothetical protein
MNRSFKSVQEGVKVIREPISMLEAKDYLIGKGEMLEELEGK